MQNYLKLLPEANLRMLLYLRSDRIFGLREKYGSFGEELG
tara:strand:- start:1028 stop:1147 length:120 start_codon:yes stop_codon:yes gene_type:complete